MWAGAVARRASEVAAGLNHDRHQTRTIAGAGAVARVAARHVSQWRWRAVERGVVTQGREVRWVLTGEGAAGERAGECAPGRAGERQRGRTQRRVGGIEPQVATFDAVESRGRVVAAAEEHRAGASGGDEDAVGAAVCEQQHFEAAGHARH